MHTPTESPATSPEDAPKRAPAIGSGRGGVVRTKLRAAIDEARTAGRMTSEHEVFALLAIRAADVVDRAARVGDERVLLAGTEKLLGLMARLPIRTEAPAGGGSGGGDGGRGKFLELVDGDPEVGDAANG